MEDRLLHTENSRRFIGFDSRRVVRVMVASFLLAALGITCLTRPNIFAMVRSVFRSSREHSTYIVNMPDFSRSNIYPGPRDVIFGTGGASPQEYLQILSAERDRTLRSIGYSGGEFDIPELRWTQTAYIQPQMHPYDRFFYDTGTGKYTVQRYLDDLRSRYGGIDAVLIWPSYTNIGIDDRNQFDYVRALPGGLEALKLVTEELHQNGVRVLWPYNPWDTGTRTEPHCDGTRYTMEMDGRGGKFGYKSDATTLASMLNFTGGDGINGDDMVWLPKFFWDASVKDGHPLAFEPQFGGMYEPSLNWMTMGWGYGFENNGAPLVDRFKFLSFGKYMTNIGNRWAKSKISMLQTVWFNGAGFEAWENVWGTWNGIVPRDGEAIRRVANMLRYFGADGYLQSPHWEPHAYGILRDGVYGSKWPHAGHNATLWTLVNRLPSNITGPQLELKMQTGRWYYDCYHGTELGVTKGQLSFSMEANGFGCILDAPSQARGRLALFLSKMKKLTRFPLSSYSAEWKSLQQSLVPIEKTSRAASAPKGMVHVPRGSFHFQVQGVEIEPSQGLDFNHDGVDVQYPWEDHPQRVHSHLMDVDAFYIDKFPVTTTNYSQYLKASGYHPKDSFNWLKTWHGSRIPPEHLADVPVTYVSLTEARQYCRWAHGGSRLPHSWEWQYAAQGVDSRSFPWGQEKDAARFPKLNHGKTFPGPEPVTAHMPAGDSPFGVSDLVGNVWQYTDEFNDIHTRSVILRGGSNYRPSGSPWYFPQALDLNTHNKYFLMDDRYERAGTVGFRCVVDAI